MQNKNMFDYTEYTGKYSYVLSLFLPNEISVHFKVSTLTISQHNQIESDQLDLEPFNEETIQNGLFSFYYKLMEH